MFYGKPTIIVLALLVLATGVSAIGVGLFDTQVEFEPGLNKNYQGFINNNVGKDIRVELKAEGPLAQYVTFSEPIINILGGRRGWFTFNLKLPEVIAPGKNRIDIGGLELPDGAEGGFATVTAAYLGFIVNAPQIGKYLTVSMTSEPIALHEVLFTFSYSHLGNVPIQSIDGSVDVWRVAGVKTQVGSLRIPPVRDLSAKDSTQRTVSWEPGSNAVGDYFAEATIQYDGREIRKEDRFRIGDLAVELINYTGVVAFDGIQPIKLQVKSFWSEPIEGVYGELFLGQDTLKTAEYTLFPWKEQELTVYVDTEILGVGIQNLAGIIYFADKELPITLQFEVVESVSEEQYSMPSMTTLLIGIVGLLILMNVLLLFFYMRKHKTKEK